MRECLKRVIAYCSWTNSKVNQEFSSRIVIDKREFSATCTGIRESCHDCFIVQNDNSFFKGTDKSHHTVGLDKVQTLKEY